MVFTTMQTYNNAGKFNCMYITNLFNYLPDENILLLVQWPSTVLGLYGGISSCILTPWHHSYDMLYHALCDTKQPVPKSTEMLLVSELALWITSLFSLMSLWIMHLLCK